MKAFSESIQNLELINQYTEPYNKVIEKGIITLFVECFNNSCRVMRTILENQGYSSAKLEFPKLTLDAATNLGLIKEEKVWTDLLASEIVATHRYTDDQVKLIIRRIKNKYINLFRQLEFEIMENWLDDIDMEVIESISYVGLGD